MCFNVVFLNIVPQFTLNRGEHQHFSNVGHTDFFVSFFLGSVYSGLFTLASRASNVTVTRDDTRGWKRAS